MTTDSSTTTAVSESEALALVRQAAQRGRERLAAVAELGAKQRAEELAAVAELGAKQRAEELAAVAERWRHVYHTLGLADWMLPYVEQPDPHRRPDDSMTVRLDLPACAPIIFVKGHTAHLWTTATCAAWVPVAVAFDHDGEQWFVRRQQGTVYDLRLLDLAIAEAEQHGGKWHTLSLEAEWRNEKGVLPEPLDSEPAPRPPVVEVEMPADPAAKVLAHIAELNYSTDDFATAARGVLYGILAIALEQRRCTESLRDELAAIRVAVEDLAAAALCDELADPSAEQDSSNVN